MGLTVVDAGVVIALLDGADVHHDSAHDVLATVRAAGDDLVLPASGLAEALVHPARHGPDAVATVEAFLDELPIDIYPVNRKVAREAAALRAAHGRLKLPDALVIATAKALEAHRVLTTDRRWPTRSALGLRATLTIVGPAPSPASG
ncbi:MAG TPA: PIN domain-containing protein [Iamia sp.]|nr:PIN domain-containing protein [Iamia sp.]